MSHAKSPEKVVQEIRRKTRRQFSAEEKIRIVLEGLRGGGRHTRRRRRSTRLRRVVAAGAEQDVGDARHGTATVDGGAVLESLGTREGRLHWRGARP